jgi:hypothetical protein
VLAVSCSAAGDCTAGGTGFVDTETKGKWATAESVPGTTGLDVSWSVSCAAPGACGAVGNHAGTVYVAVEKDGVWQRAESVPGLASLDKGRGAVANALSCGAVGSCAAGGSYAAGAHDTEAFVVAERQGVWATAERLPGLSALNKGGYASVSALSCASAGDCSAGGLYTDGSRAQQAFVVSQTAYNWGTATNLPGLRSMNKGAYALVSALSCTSPLDCSAGGIYTDGKYDDTAFAASRTSGKWQSSFALGAINGLASAPSVGVDQISCSSAGNCAAGGFYTDTDDRQQAFVVTETRGKWSAGAEVRGTKAANTGRSALVSSVSCRSTGNCTAGGLYTLASGSSVVFTVSEVNGAWGSAKVVRGVGNYDSLYSVSCAAPASCLAGLGARPGFPGYSYVLAEIPDS